MNRTGIEWTTFSSNPLKYRRKSDGKVVWACVKTSLGCAHCYSEQITLRYVRGKLFNAKNMEELEPFLDEAELRQLLTRKTCDGLQVSGSRVFVGDMTDLFGEWVPDELLDRLFATFALRPDVTFQVLTKRAERMAKYWNDGYRNGRGEHTSMYVYREAMRIVEKLDWSAIAKDEVDCLVNEWPKNCWAGVSVEDQQRADERIPHLLRTPAAVRFLSCEPLLGPVNLERWIGPASRMWDGDYGSSSSKMTALGKIGWTIVGGESGSGARPCNLRWIANIVSQCQAAGVACFVKQIGSNPYETEPGAPEEATASGIKMRDKKGGNPSKWPKSLQVREMPTTAKESVQHS